MQWHSHTMQALADRGDAPKRNQIWYWASSQVTLYTQSNVVSHTFETGKGVVTLDAAVESVAQWFRGTPITGVQLPDKTQSIGTNAFYQCTSLTNAILPDSITEIAGNSFWNSKIVLAVLPKSLQSIRGNAFRNCPLTITELPSGITTIANSAFNNCLSITELTFLGTPSSIGSSAFGGCTNLTTIRVPWAEGAVSDAPWGATNATITYNYTPQ